MYPPKLSVVAHFSNPPSKTKNAEYRNPLSLMLVINAAVITIILNTIFFDSKMTLVINSKCWFSFIAFLLI